MATYGSVIPSQDRFYDFKGIFSSIRHNQKQQLFFTDIPSFIISGLHVSLPNNTDVQVTSGRAIVSTELIVINNNVTITKPATLTDYVVALVISFPVSPQVDAEIQIMDIADFDINTMALLAVVCNNNLYYVINTANLCYSSNISLGRITYSSLSMILERYQITIASQTTQVPYLLTYNQPDDSIYVSYNGILLRTGTDYIIDITTRNINFVNPLLPNDIISVEYVG